MASTIKEAIDRDLKSAMLAQDKNTVTVLRTIKSVILDAEVKTGTRDSGLPDTEVTALLQKEAKKRKESAEIYTNAGDETRAKQELSEIEIINRYLPEMMSEEEVLKVIDEVVTTMGTVSMQQMGQVIGAVKAKTGAQADGAVIARLVQTKITK